MNVMNISKENIFKMHVSICSAMEPVVKKTHETLASLPEQDDKLLCASTITVSYAADGAVRDLVMTIMTIAVAGIVGYNCWMAEMIMETFFVALVSIYSIVSIQDTRKEKLKVASLMGIISNTMILNKKGHADND